MSCLDILASFSFFRDLNDHECVSLCLLIRKLYTVFCHRCDAERRRRPWERSWMRSRKSQTSPTIHTVRTRTLLHSCCLSLSLKVWSMQLFGPVAWQWLFFVCGVLSSRVIRSSATASRATFTLTQWRCSGENWCSCCFFGVGLQ